MGVYYRKFRKSGRRIWWLSYTAGGRQVFESSRSTSKRFAERLLAIRQAEVAEGRYEMLKASPRLGAWSERYLQTIANLNTRKRYAVSNVNLIRFFGEAIQLNGITAGGINEFIYARRNEGVKAATINRDLRFLSQILKQAERERCLGRSPFDLGRFFQSEADRRRPHILTESEEVRLLTVVSPRLRLLLTLGAETGMRTGEMLALRWEDIDIAAGILYVRRSKTQSGVRIIPLTGRCQTELLKWRSLIGPAFSPWTFPKFENRRHPLLRAGRKAWASALKKADLSYFPIYNLRHTFASRMVAAGVSAVTVAALLGHSSSQIVSRYAQVLDQNRIDAVNRLELFRQSTSETQSTPRQ